MRGINSRMRLGLALIALLATAACGGGSSPDPNPNPDPNNPGGAQGNLGNGNNLPVDPADRPVAEPVEWALDEAPLGVNPTFNVQAGGATVASHTTSKSGSELGIGEEFAINWVTIAKNDIEPDPEATELVFSEGEQVDLWMEYEVAPNTSLERSWDINVTGLEFTEEVTHVDEGVYQVKLDFILPYGSATEEGKMTVFLNPPRQSSVIAIGDTTASKSVTFSVESVGVQAPISYPPDPDNENDQQGGGGGCTPEDITVEFNTTSVNVVSEMDLSNVVLEFADGKRQKHDDLNQGKSGTFAGTGENNGKTITRCWVKSGCNGSGDGPGYGERFAPTYEQVGMAQMVWEDLIINSDYDYNDFVGRLRASEIRNVNDELVQIQLTVKAVARGSGHDADWQFNVDAALPGANVLAIVDQYHADGTRNGAQRLWTSEDGASIPIFSPTRDALPNPPDHQWATNVVAGTTFVDGDYAEVLILVDIPMPQGTYTPQPYEPELKVTASNGNVYTIGLWRQPGDDVDSNGRPLAFIVPDTYSWPLEGKFIWGVYPDFNSWVHWINDPDGDPPTPNWWDTVPVSNDFQRDLFL